MAYSLNAKQVEEIKARRISGETYASIAEKFGVTFQHIEAICSGRRKKLSVSADLPGEDWRLVSSIPVLLASNLGRIKRVETGRVLKIRVAPHGYNTISFSFESKKRLKLVHRLVAEAWLGSCPSEKQVNHKDGNKSNNTPQNLEYLSPGENDLHAYRTGLKDAKGEKNGRAKLTEEVIKKIRALASNGDHYSQIARSFGITPSHCHAIITKKYWGHVV